MAEETRRSQSARTDTMSHPPSDDTRQRQRVESTLTMQRILSENIHTDTTMDISMFGIDMIISYLCVHAPLVENFIYGSVESHNDLYLTGRIPSKARLLPMALPHFALPKVKRRNKSCTIPNQSSVRQNDKYAIDLTQISNRERSSTIESGGDSASSTPSSGNSSQRDNIASPGRDRDNSQSRKKKSTDKKKQKTPRDERERENEKLPYHMRRGKPRSVSSLSIYAFGHAPVKQYHDEFPRVAFEVSDEDLHRNRCKVLATAIVDMKRLQYKKNGRSEPFRNDALIIQLAEELFAWSDFKMEAFSAVYASPTGISGKRLFGDEYPKWLVYVRRILEDCVVDTRSIYQDGVAFMYSSFIDADGIAIIRCDTCPDDLWLIHVSKICINNQNNSLNAARVATNVESGDYPDVAAAYRRFFNAAHISQTTQVIAQELKTALCSDADISLLDTSAIQTTLISIWNRSKYDTLTNTLRVSLCIDRIMKHVVEFGVTKLEARSKRSHKVFRRLLEGFENDKFSIPLDPDWMTIMVGQLEDVQRLSDTSSDNICWNRQHRLLVMGDLKAHAQVVPVDNNTNAISN